MISPVVTSSFRAGTSAARRHHRSSSRTQSIWRSRSSSEARQTAPHHTTTPTTRCCARSCAGPRGISRRAACVGLRYHANVGCQRLLAVRCRRAHVGATTQRTTSRIDRALGLSQTHSLAQESSHAPRIKRRALEIGHMQRASGKDARWAIRAREESLILRRLSLYANIADLPMRMFAYWTCRACARPEACRRFEGGNITPISRLPPYAAMADAGAGCLVGA